MARWTVLDGWEGAYLRVASAWQSPGGRGCLWGTLLLIEKHFQEPSDCFLVLSFLQMLPLGKEMVLLMEPGFTCLTYRSSSHFCLSFSACLPRCESSFFTVIPIWMLSLDPPLQSCEPWTSVVDFSGPHLPSHWHRDIASVSRPLAEKCQANF